MGRKRKTADGKDPLRWYEIMTCCCKWRAECKSFFTIMFLYYVPIFLLLCLAGSCVTIGVIWREDCSYKTLLPYWLIVSSVTPFILFTFINAVKSDYLGITMWRIVSLMSYIIFVAWLIIGSMWIYDTWGYACDSCCNYTLKLFAFIVTFMHWLLAALATIPQVYIFVKICCCNEENAIRSGKPSFVGEDYDFDYYI